MTYIHIAGYKFVSMAAPDSMRTLLWSLAQPLSIKGTILLSHEGININIAGKEAAIQEFEQALQANALTVNMSFHRHIVDELPYRALKIKLKKEIITLRHADINMTMERAPAISPAILKQWLDEKRELVLLDTRNDFEVNYGTFTGAVNLHIDRFTQFPEASHDLDKNKPIVMFCTGGIRCEKAAIYMRQQGYTSVYQLDGGILGYFNQVGGAHYQGGCFVFDERVTVQPPSFAD